MRTAKTTANAATSVQVIPRGTIPAINVAAQARSENKLKVTAAARSPAKKRRSVQCLVASTQRAAAAATSPAPPVNINRSGILGFPRPADENRHHQHPEPVRLVQTAVRRCDD